MNVPERFRLDGQVSVATGGAGLVIQLTHLQSVGADGRRTAFALFVHV